MNVTQFRELTTGHLLEDDVQTAFTEMFAQFPDWDDLWPARIRQGELDILMCWDNAAPDRLIVSVTSPEGSNMVEAMALHADDDLPRDQPALFGEEE